MSNKNSTKKQARTSNDLKATQVRQPTDCVTCEDIQSEFMDFERSFLNNLNVKRHGEQTGAPFSRLQPPCSGCTRGEQRELYHDIGEDNQEIRSDSTIENTVRESQHQTDRATSFHVSDAELSGPT